jgi:hypothetical protein
MSKVLLDHRGDVLKYMQDDGDKVFEVTEQDLDPVLRHTQMLRETHVQSSDMKLAAVIPMEVVERMMRDGSFNDPAAIKRWCNDPQNAPFRVWKGKL